MTDATPAEIATEQPPPRPGIAIAEVAIDLERGQSIVTLKLMSPGIIRACAFWPKKPAVLGSASMRATDVIPMPLLFVECDPAGEMRERVLLFLPSNVPFAPREGFKAEHRATAIGQTGALHVYEIVAVES